MSQSKAAVCLFDTSIAKESKVVYPSNFFWRKLRETWNKNDLVLFIPSDCDQNMFLGDTVFIFDKI